MRASCTRHDVLLIADEVMTGWGRTGSLLACDQAGVVPDILCLSKGLTGGAVPLAVTMATPAIRSEEHTSELQSLMRISYAVFCLNKKKKDGTIRRRKYNITKQYERHK